ncbi:cation-translocating P-type ATPase [Desulfonatronovibrio magnus]|uniref:cation-translocating P-type ATPase n=1 Tax=Desulfonatronovibrio magnus TaxID=698827 RepID=UPI0006962558|nr:HAD-IC family P-type ATPase [Desulfonatronovibrio magnus]
MKNKQELQETAWHTKDSSDLLSEFETDKQQGLSGDESKKRRDKYGPNKIRTGEKKSWYVILLHQFTDPLIYILLIAAVVSLFIQEIIDASVIMAVVILNGAIGFIQETRARKAIQSLAEMSAPKAKVIRDGQKEEINSEDVVPGDIVVMASGGSVPADCRLLEARDLAADESALTGESEPVRKQTEAVDDDKAVPGDQYSMVFAGTHITSGRGKGIAVRTGEVSELGRIAEKTKEMGDVETPIQEKMAWLGKAIGVAVFVLSLVVIGMGLLMGWEPREIIRTAVALAVGTVPEALPIVLTVTLAVGVQRMAKRNAIIRQLPAVETLGSTTVIGSDKTGTLTANQMTVKAIWTGGNRYQVTGTGYNADGEIKSDQEDKEEGDEAVKKILLAGLLASETDSLPDKEEGGGGDPTEMALLASALKGGYDLKETRNEYSQLDIIPFESEQKFMATLNETPDGTGVFLKGAPEAVLERCSRQLTSDGGEEDLDKDKARETAKELADEGYRVIGLALGSTDQKNFDGNDPGDGLIFAGFQGLEDPVRPEAVDAVKAAHESGIRVLMLTGDHARTARAIGHQLGLDDEDGRAEEGRNLEDMSDDDIDDLVKEVNIYARVSPEHKLKLVETLKGHGHIVAVTGDGVNDAPALQAAHLGVAMGKAGTDVAREASDMVLADDNFSSITNAVREGRVVFANIRKVTYFLLSTGVGLVITILSALFGPWHLPYVAAQVLWINLVTKGLQDVSLAFEPGEPGLLREPPRSPKEGVINKPVLMRMIGFGIYMAIGTLAVFWWVVQQDVSLEMSRSVAMTQMVMFQFFHVFNCRSMHRSLFQMNPLGNPYLLGSVGLALLAHLGILHVSWLQAVFSTEPLSLEIWAVIVAVSATIIVVSEIDKMFIRWSRKKAAEKRSNKQHTTDNKE